MTPDHNMYRMVDDLLGLSWVALDGKRPIEKGWNQYCDIKHPLSQIRHTGNLGICTGTASGIIVLDIDNRAKFDQFCRDTGVKVPATFSVKTGRGGLHLYYKRPDDDKRYSNRSYSNGSGIFDIRADGGQVVAAGSVHPDTGNIYEVESWAKVVAAPQWALDYSLTGNLPGKAPTPTTTPAPVTTSMFNWGHSIDGLPIKQSTKDSIVNSFPVGQRSEPIMTVLCALVWSNLSDSEIFQIFEVEAIGEKYRGKGATKEKWLQGQIDKARLRITDRARPSGASSAPGGTSTKVTTKTNDHLQPAKEVAASYGEGNICFAPDKCFWVWREKGVWERIDDREVKARVLNLGDVKLTRGFVDAVTDMVKTVTYSPELNWDAVTEGVNCLNGEIVHSNGEFVLQPHCREHYRTSLIPVNYDPKALAPRFLKYLNEIFQGDSDCIEKGLLALEIIGYTLQSHCRYEKFVLLVGPGANGKSVLMSILAELLGQKNVCAVNPSQFENRFQRAYLHCKLANIVSEIPEGHVIADAALKAITSGELTTAEHKNKDPFDLRPYCTCWFGTNHMPHTRDFSEALFRRAIILPFNRIFAESEQDKKLTQKLAKELPGILRLSLEAFAGVIERGTFTQTESTEKAKRDWRLESDQAAQFLKEACEVGPEFREESANLYQAYRIWANDNGITRTLTKRTFTSRLLRLGCEKTRGTGGARMIAGLMSKSCFQKGAF